jgi:hypothetical protein
LDNDETEWNEAEIEQALRERSEELLGLQKEFFNLMTSLGLRALKRFQGARRVPLNSVQMRQIVVTEIQFVVETLSDQAFIDMVAQKAKRDFVESGYEGSAEPSS